MHDIEWFFHHRGRLILGFVLALLFHIAVFGILQRIVHFKEAEPSEYRGPVVVTLMKPVPTVSHPQRSRVEKKPVVEVKKKVLPRVVSRKVMQKPTKFSAVKEKPALESRKVIAPKPQEEISTNQSMLPLNKQAGSKEAKTGIVTKHQKREEIPLLPTPEGKLPPIKYESPREKPEKKPIPFKPGAEIEEQPLSFNLSKLKETLGKPTESQTGTPGSKELATPQEMENVASLPPSASEIQWEEGSHSRTLVYRGPMPKIPEWVKKEGLTLTIGVSFTVNPDGYTTEVKVIRSSGYSDVDTAILEAVRKMRFNPIKDKTSAHGKIRYIIRPQ